MENAQHEDISTKILTLTWLSYFEYFTALYPHHDGKCEREREKERNKAKLHKTNGETAAYKNYVRGSSCVCMSLFQELNLHKIYFFLSVCLFVMWDGVILHEMNISLP